MRPLLRLVSLGFALSLVAVPLFVAGPAQGTVITVPAQVNASSWTVMPNTTTTTSANTRDERVSCVTSMFCISVGSPYTGGTATDFPQRWNGTTWSPLTAPTVPGSTETVYSGVSCVTTTFCIVVGTADLAGGFSPLIEQWNGTTFVVVQAVQAATNTRLANVSCTSVIFCMATGLTGTLSVPYMEQWNGSTWTPTTLPNPTGSTFNQMYDISCVNPISCMAVGNSHTTVDIPLAEYWNGSTWTMTTVPTGAVSDVDLNGVSCAGLSFCAAVGFSGASSLASTFVATWNGTTWSDASTPNTSPNHGNYLYGVGCISATSCTAVGSFYTSTDSSGPYATEALTWNGQSWQLVNTPNGPSTPQFDVFEGVTCLTNWACVAVGFTKNGSDEAPFEAKAPIARTGYRFVASDGGVFNFGPGAPSLGSLGGMSLNAPIVGMAVMPAGDGYYLVAADGGVFTFGSAQFYGSTGNLHLNKPIVGMAVTADGGGYWLVASDGGIFSFGDAWFYGSTGNLVLNKPIVGMATAVNGLGYYLVASDGGIFSFPAGAGGPTFFGSTGNLVLNKPIVGMTVPVSGGYYLVATDGGIFAFPTGAGGLPFYGSTGNITLNKPIVGMAAVAGGYYLSGSDGGIFSFPGGGVPPFYGSTGNIVLNKPIVGLAG
jgi:hypothetical protein